MGCLVGLPLTGCRVLFRPASSESDPGGSNTSRNSRLLSLQSAARARAYTCTIIFSYARHIHLPCVFQPGVRVRARARARVLKTRCALLAGAWLHGGVDDSSHRPLRRLTDPPLRALLQPQLQRSGKKTEERVGGVPFDNKSIILHAAVHIALSRLYR